jgi:hypothetical protein
MPQYSHWHYILGYLIVTISHNWPALLALLMGFRSAWWLYHTPTRRNVQWLYGWVMLLFAYEYAKHLSDELARPVVFLFTTDWAWVQPVGVLLVTCAPPPILIVLALALLLRALGRPSRYALGSQRVSHQRERT